LKVLVVMKNIVLLSKDHLSQTMLERLEEDPNSPFAEEFFND